MISRNYSEKISFITFFFHFSSIFSPMLLDYFTFFVLVLCREGAARGPAGAGDVPARLVLAAHGHLPALLRHAAQRVHHHVRHLERHRPPPCPGRRRRPGRRRDRIAGHAAAAHRRRRRCLHVAQRHRLLALDACRPSVRSTAELNPELECCRRWNVDVRPTTRPCPHLLDSAAAVHRAALLAPSVALPSDR